jgi:hypothetical protein
VEDLFVGSVFNDFFPLFYVYVLYIAGRRVCSGEELVSVLDISNENMLDFVSGGSDNEIRDSSACESESCESDSEPGGMLEGVLKLLIWMLDKGELFQCKILNVKELNH